MNNPGDRQSESSLTPGITTVGSLIGSLHSDEHQRMVSAVDRCPNYSFNYSFSKATVSLSFCKAIELDGEDLEATLESEPEGCVRAACLCTMYTMTALASCNPQEPLG